FTAGWIALRFLNDPATALAHFAKVAQGSNPITLARAGYWQGRAAEALGRRDEARAHYEAAARYSPPHYGPRARPPPARPDLAARPPPGPPWEGGGVRAGLEGARALDFLPPRDGGDRAAGARADRGDRSTAPFAPAASGAAPARHKDARAMVLL